MYLFCLVLLALNISSCHQFSACSLYVVFPSSLPVLVWLFIVISPYFNYWLLGDTPLPLPTNFWWLTEGYSAHHEHPTVAAAAVLADGPSWMRCCASWRHVSSLPLVSPWLRERKAQGKTSVVAITVALPLCNLASDLGLFFFGRGRFSSTSSGQGCWQ